MRNKLCKIHTNVYIKHSQIPRYSNICLSSCNNISAFKTFSFTAQTNHNMHGVTSQCTNQWDFIAVATQIRKGRSPQTHDSSQLHVEWNVCQITTLGEFLQTNIYHFVNQQTLQHDARVCGLSWSRLLNWLELCLHYYSFAAVWTPIPNFSLQLHYEQ